MNNLTTRKIVLGMLMTLVLAFSVQGIADAISMTPTSNKSHFVRLTIGETITIGGITGAASVNDVTETVSISVTRNLAEFEDPDDTSDTTYSHTWTESEPAENAQNGTFSFNAGGRVAINPLKAGELTVTVSWTIASGKTDNFVQTYYVVKDRLDVDLEDTIDLEGVSNGVGYPYDHRQDIEIYGGDNDHNAVTYKVTGNGTLYVKKGNLVGERALALPTAGLETSSGAEVWLSMGTRSAFIDNMLSPRPTSGNTNTVTVTVDSNSNKTTGIYIYGRPTLVVATGDGNPTLNTDPALLEGNPGRVLAPAIKVEVFDEQSPPIQVAGVPVTFDVADKNVTGGRLRLGSAGVLVDGSNNVLTNPPTLPRTLYVRTAESGTVGSREAVVDFQVGTAPGKAEITVKAVGMTEKVEIRVKGGEAITLSEGDNEKRSGNSKLFDLVALVEEDGEGVEDVIVTFTTARGTLTNTPATGTADSGRIITETTDESGRAQVIYDIGSYTGRQEIDASIFGADDDDAGTTNFDESDPRQELTFVVNGPAGSGGGDDGGGDGGGDDIISFSRTSITGEAGDEEEIRVTSTPSGVVVSLSSPDFANSNFSPQSETTPFTTTLTLPDETGAHVIFATRSGFTEAEGTVTVEAEGLGTLTISPSGAATNGEQRVNITARTSGGTIPAGAVPVTLSGTGFTTTRATVLTGAVSTNVTLPTTAATYTLTVRATGYNPATTRLTVSTTTTRGPAGVADSVEIDGQRQLSGTVNQVMRLRVRVLDANDDGVSDVRVAFRVLAPGRGTFSGGRGNRRGVTDETDRNGYASANFTPSDDGNIIVRATPAGVRDPVTFIIAVGEAADDPEPPTPSEDAAPSREISPVVHLGMASRPPMLWVDGGAIYALVGADAQRFAPSVDNAMNIAIGGGKVYWTEKTGESGGTINSANLNGSDVKELASIFATPIGIAVDTAGSKLYWTNSSGRIQSANLDGSGITNVIAGGLESPMDLALAGGNGYWTQGNGSVRVGNLTSRVTRVISTGTDTPGSIVIGGNKVYWTEMTGDSSGTIKSANLNGTDVKELTSIQAVPSGIAVDTVRSKLYWTNSRGRVQSANLDGSKITNVVSGLGSPGELVLSNSIMAPAAAPAETASGSKYDVNGDGTVDEGDKKAIAVALVAESTDAKYDVNGDGAVDAFDLLEIIDNLTPGAAGAPTLFGMQLTVAQIDRLQEQIDLLIAANDRSPAALRTLIYLQQLLVTARPEKTQLLANYPNPFNPETWIPYELATDTNVKVTIYNTQGVVIRTLQLGHQSAGYYTGRDRAAYWDGRNALGEQVASGLYFYQLETDEMSLMRKMVILK